MLLSTYSLQMQCVHCCIDLPWRNLLPITPINNKHTSYQHNGCPSSFNTLQDFTEPFSFNLTPRAFHDKTILLRIQSHGIWSLLSIPWNVKTTLFQTKSCYCLKFHASFIPKQSYWYLHCMEVWKFVSLTLALVSPVRASHMVEAFTKKKGGKAGMGEVLPEFMWCTQLFE